MTPILSPKYHS